jgi:hypothetical protein
MLHKILKKFGKLSKAKPSHPERLIQQVAIFGYADAIEHSQLFQSVVVTSKKLAEGWLYW